MYYCSYWHCLFFLFDCSPMRAGPICLVCCLYPLMSNPLTGIERVLHEYSLNRREGSKDREGHGWDTQKELVMWQWDSAGSHHRYERTTFIFDSYFFDLNFQRYHCAHSVYPLEKGNLNWHPWWNFDLPRSDWDAGLALPFSKKTAEIVGVESRVTPAGIWVVCWCLQALVGGTAACFLGEKKENMASDVCGTSYSL